jgi:hypothetical protein
MLHVGHSRGHLLGKVALVLRVHFSDQRDYAALFTSYFTLSRILFWIDKNSLWGGLNIQKRELCVKGILAQDLAFVGVRGVFGVEVERGRFQRSARLVRRF